MRVHFIQHEFFESPGAYLSWAEARGHRISFSRVYKYDPLPVDVDGLDLLIVLGGPQSPDTPLAECGYFDAKAEIALIRRCVEADKAVLGVCLGAQLLGEAFGAKCEHSPEKEIGNFPIRLTSIGAQDPLIEHMGAVTVTGHWHNDMPGLTPEAEVLAVSGGCPRQMVRYKKGVYGFQCHLEFTRESIGPLLDSEPQLEEESRKFRFVQSPQDMRQYDYSGMNAKLFAFLDKLSTLIG